MLKVNMFMPVRFRILQTLAIYWGHNKRTVLGMGGVGGVVVSNNKRSIGAYKTNSFLLFRAMQRVNKTNVCVCVCL